jgi:hypothetical protein
MEISLFLPQVHTTKLKLKPTALKNSLLQLIGVMFINSLEVKTILGLSEILIKLFSAMETLILGELTV